MNKITNQLETVTPDMAKRFLKDNVKNRKLKKRLVDQIANDIKKGQFHLTHQGIAFDTKGELLDGQHRLAAIVQAGKSVPLYVTRGLDPEMMNVVDVGAKRTQSDMLGIHGYENATVLAAAAQIYYNYMQDNFAMTQKSGRYVNNFELLGFVQDHPELIDACKWVGNNKKVRQLGYPAVITAFWVILHKKNKTKAGEFFKVLIENYSEKRNHPAMVLNEHILRKKAQDKKLPRAYLMAAFCRSWENFIRNEFVSNIVIKDANQVIRDFK